MTSLSNEPQAPKLISADELATLLTPAQKQTDNHVQVVDVRDEDFAGGNVVGAHNFPSKRASPEGFDQLAKELKERNVNKVVFHCTLSKIRGPDAAREYAEALKRAGESDQEIFVLVDGFGGFQQKFKGDPTLVEKHDPLVWTE